ncbi:MAG: hypothetical protein IT162_05495 [Bryobacterales bacterium]|nr:hypothetical protein [Bryobacterales bacterium]
MGVTHDWRAVAALYAGLFWNAGVFAAVTWQEGYLSFLELGTGAALLAGGFFLPGARDPLAVLLHERFGPSGAWLFVHCLLPLWLAAWLGESMVLAANCWRGELAGFFFVLAVALLWGGHPARGSALLLRVSVAIALGPLIGAVRSVPDAFLMNRLFLPVLPSLHMSTPLLWAAPALLLAGYFTVRPPRPVAVWGVGAGMLAACSCAIITITAAGFEQIKYRHVPDYFGYVYQHGGRVDLIRLALLSLTLITAIRVAAYFAHALAPDAVTRRLPRWIFLALFCAAAGLLGTRWSWHGQPAAALMALPFVPLAGVLSARGGGTPRWAVCIAWTAGFLLTCAPLSMREFELEQPAVFPGWALAFLLASASRLLGKTCGLVDRRTRMSDTGD